MLALRYIAPCLFFIVEILLVLIGHDANIRAGRVEWASRIGQRPEGQRTIDLLPFPLFPSSDDAISSSDRERSLEFNPIVIVILFVPGFGAPAI